MTTLVKDLAMALDPVLFAQRASGFVLDNWQERVLRSVSKRIILNCARQTGKSTTAGELADHQAIYHPGSLVLMLSPSLRQSSELFRTASSLLAGLDDKPVLVEDNRLSLTMDSGSRIVSLPSKEGTIRGYASVDLIIVDEASRVPDDLYRALRPMLAVSGGRLVLMSTPFGKRGFFHEEWTAGGDTWERIEVKATECSRISAEFLEEERKSMGDWWFRQEYECEFVETVDQIFSYELVAGMVTAEVKPLFGDPGQ